MKTLFLLLLTGLGLSQVKATPITFSPNRNIVICGATTVYFVYNKEITPDLIYWDFGDGGTSLEINPEHYYSKPGVYDVKLVVIRNNVRDSLIKKGMITIKPNPEVDFEKKIINENSSKTGVEFQFVSTSKHCSQGFTKVQWIIEEDTLKGDTAYHVFKHDGEFYINLMVENTQGCKAEKTSQISISNSGVDLPSGLHENLMSRVKFYPNPADKQCYIELNNNKTEVHVYNMLGAMQYIPVSVISGNQLLIDVSTLPNGTYQLKMVDDKQITTRLLVVNH